MKNYDCQLEYLRLFTLCQFDDEHFNEEYLMKILCQC
jgi:hypothetical protein